MSTIKELRKKAKLTQVQLANKAGISIPTLIRMENSKIVMKANLLCVCYALGVNPEEINGVRVRGVSTVEQLM